MQLRFVIIVAMLLIMANIAIVAQQPTGKIGFVDLKKIFRDYQKIKQMEDSIRQETELELSKLKSLKEESKQLQDEIPLYKAGSKVRLQKEKKLAELMFDMKNREEKANYLFSQRLKTELENVYHEITDEIELYAQKNNFFMVLRISDADFFGTQSPDALRMQIHTRDIIYWQKDNDITNVIIDTLNQKFKKESGK